MRIVSGSEASEMIERIAARGQQVGASDSQAHGIVNEVRQSGVAGLRRLAEQWDGVRRQDPVRVQTQGRVSARRALPAALRKSITQSAGNSRRFCEMQRPRSWTRTRLGITVGQ